MADHDCLPCYCGRTVRKEDSHIIELSEEEKAFFRANGLTPKRFLLVCPACWELMKHPEHGAQLLKGAQQQVLRAIGVPNAEELSESARKKFLAKKGTVKGDDSQN